MPAYPAAVERWRPLVEQAFRPEDVDKALWVIMHESGGRPEALGDGGYSHGLFQVQDNRRFAGRPTAEALHDPAQNIRWAAQAVYGGSGWSPWGEGATYQGKPFGALGNFPYPDTAPGNIESNTLKPTGGTPPPPPPQGGPMDRDAIVQDLYPGKKWADLNDRQKFLVQEALDKQPKDANVGDRVSLRGPDGLMHLYEYNPQTKQFDIDRGISQQAASPASERQPQGAITESELRQAGAKFGIGEALLGKTKYKKNPDGTYSISGEVTGKTLSGAGMARLYGAQQGQGNTTSGSLSELPAPAPTLGNGAGRGSVYSLSDIEMNPELTLGAAEPLYTGLKSPLPLTEGGIYEGGGMSYIPGTGMGSTTQYSGRIPGEGGLPDRSIGFGFNAMDLPEIRALGNVKPENMSDVALNIMSNRQTAMDKGLNFPDLEAIKNREAQGYAPKGSYKEALAKLGKAVDSPLSALDLFLMPDVKRYDEEEDPLMQAHGGRNVAGAPSTTGRRDLTQLDESLPWRSTTTGNLIDWNYLQSGTTGQSGIPFPSPENPAMPNPGAAGVSYMRTPPGMMPAGPGGGPDVNYPLGMGTNPIDELLRRRRRNFFQAEGGSNVAGLEDEEQRRNTGYVPGGIGNSTGFVTDQTIGMFPVDPINFQPLSPTPLSVASELGPDGKRIPEAINVEPLGPRPEFGMDADEVTRQRQREGFGRYGSMLPSPAPTRMERFWMDPAIASRSQMGPNPWYGARPSVSRDMAYTPGAQFNMGKAENLAQQILGYSTANTGGAMSQLINRLMERPDMYENVPGFAMGYGQTARMANGGTGLAGLPAPAMPAPYMPPSPISMLPNPFPNVRTPVPLVDPARALATMRT